MLDLVVLLPYRGWHAVALPLSAHKMLEVIRALMAQLRVLLLGEPAAA